MSLATYEQMSFSTETPVPAIGIGFLVRVPVEERDDGDSREYRIGRVTALADDFGDLEVELREEAVGDKPVAVRRRYPAGLIARCRILPDAPFERADTGTVGRIFLAATDGWQKGEPLDYFALIQGEVVSIPETCIVVGSTYQDPDPRRQLQRYELHNPRWKECRDVVVETMAELRNSTYGLEELVGSRVNLLAHQADVVAKVLASGDGRFILADEVGLGKTIEAGVILKGLRRRNPRLKVLIVAPGSLVHQWQRELDDRFWLRFRLYDDNGISAGDETGTIDRLGLIVSAETLSTDHDLQAELRERTWDLVIVDEAHQVRKDPVLTGLLRGFSRRAERALVLSATPIQRRADEYIDLLRLLDPDRYERVTDEEFTRLLEAQGEVRRTVSFLARSLDPELFEASEFVDEIGGLVERLSHDEVLGDLVAAVTGAAGEPDRGLAAAQEALAYVSENYRIERRMIRNRRAHLYAPLPVRTLDESYAYEPSDAERAAKEALLDYVTGWAGRVETAVATEYMRVFLHAAASSPAALLDLIQQRQSALTARRSGKPPEWTKLLAPASPRQETARIAALVKNLPAIDGVDALARLDYLTRRWHDEEEAELVACLKHRSGRRFPSSSRLGRVLAAIVDAIGDQGEGKVLVFSSWRKTLETLAPYVALAIGAKSAAVFRADLSAEALQQAVDRFQTDPSCQVLLSDELGGEGRNFQITDAIVHLDLPWTPALVEQRIGRVDRIGRSGSVRSIVVVARETPEEQLFHLWHRAFQLFTRSMSGLEIALERIQDEVAAALAANPRRGLADLLPPMEERVVELREIVEEEAYFDQGTINRRLRDDFTAMTATYRDGRSLSRAIAKWSSVAGLRPDYMPGSDIVTYSPKTFGEASMRNAKVVSLPNMEEALRRSRRRNTLEVRGTFNRSVAVQREDLVFFAPGSDPWTDAVIANAIAADRGRSCAVLTKDAPVNWNGLEFLYTFAIDPRPLYQLGYDPTKLFEAQGYLRLPTLRVFISFQGEILDTSHPAAEAIRAGLPPKSKYEHLGERKGSPSNLDHFRDRFPPEQWRTRVRRWERQVLAHVRRELAFLEDEAENAREAFAARERGRRAAARWFRTEAAEDAELEVHRQISNALVEGIRRPLIRLESVCCWMLRPPKGTV